MMRGWKRRGRTRCRTRFIYHERRALDLSARHVDARSCRWFMRESESKPACNMSCLCRRVSAAQLFSGILTQFMMQNRHSRDTLHTPVHLVTCLSTYVHPTPPPPLMSTAFNQQAWLHQLNVFVMRASTGQSGSIEVDPSHAAIRILADTPAEFDQTCAARADTRGGNADAGSLRTAGHSLNHRWAGGC
jgi:hypothetical protein